MPNQVKLLNTFLKNQGYQQVKLRKSKTQHLLIKGFINDIDANFLLDTGAGGTVMDLNVAEHFNVKYKKVEDDEAAGLSGEKMDMYESNDSELTIDGFHISKMKVRLIDMGPLNAVLQVKKNKQIHCMIGADILEKFIAVIDYDKRRMYLKNPIE